MMNMLVVGVVGTCRRRDVDAVVGQGIGQKMVRSGCKRVERLMVAWFIGSLVGGLVAGVYIFYLPFSHRTCCLPLG